ncbi:hypothetical protein LMG33818_001491 [Halomonadaceae bacterium LMG 33818]|uniref:KAP family P-loop NTPase fold protein n=1 Tax=Cernens ardua TaxID=3402176 RepID=UPI003EDB6E0A
MQSINPDSPLSSENALENDRFNRSGFAKSAVEALKMISGDSGFVMSIEGEWGSGKTSILSMMEQLIKQEDGKALFVHFNPWLIGDRDALLNQFFVAIAKALYLTDDSDLRKNVIKALDAYVKIFEFTSYIPTLSTASKALSAGAKTTRNLVSSYEENKKNDMEGRKKELEDSLRAFGFKIYVFIDDLDRLYPKEIYEMIRIVKAVGDLPNVGYILSYDPFYLTESLNSNDIPSSSLYLDKIVQLRMPMPFLKFSDKKEFFYFELSKIDQEALNDNGLGGGSFYGELYYLARMGFWQLCRHPRDIIRILNTLQVIEKNLRGEIVFSNILGLACLIVKAPPFFEELKKYPGLFCGDNSFFGGHFLEDEQTKKFKDKIERIILECDDSQAIRLLCKYLFPEFFDSGTNIQPRQRGSISNKDRLQIPLGQAISSGDTSLSMARKYVYESKERKDIEYELSKSGDYKIIIGNDRFCFSII